ncbi:phosphoesterase [Geomonas sp. RF6]|uniref:tyrosine-protein phosphatase n=1 Tax=Geomonas sp. RF6 TaxID=2897342 RepID=UPI001E4F2BEC|nr:CpsB/CapC family capsule biosynthesis tyrosine phosphatase [Geomonas sp. RF6]UFS69767.1 phosphoesterase [Geomonas sp. RF6]
MVDYHSHLLPGIDDGAYALEESLAMARALVAVGFTVAHCTPHLIKGAYETAPGRVRELTAILQKHYDEAGIALKLVPGTEHYLDEYLGDFLDEAVTVGESRCLLVEAPFRASADVVAAHADHLLQRGFVPLFAHPERCAAFAPASSGGGFLSGILGKRKGPVVEGTLLAKLKERGCRYQGNLGSFAGVYGEDIRQRAILFLENGIYSCLGSDAHRVDRLEAVLRRGIATVEEAVGKEGAAALLQWRA